MVLGNLSAHNVL